MEVHHTENAEQITHNTDCDDYVDVENQSESNTPEPLRHDEVAAVLQEHQAVNGKHF